MTYSDAPYRPSLLELAQEGNCRALTYWMNSFLAPQGIYVRVQPDSANFLKVLIDFRRPRRREACLHLRDRLARAICYRLWTLNSDVIRGVRLVARVAGDPKVLWQLSVQINSPAAVKVRRAEATSLRQMQAMNQFRFRVARSLFMSSITLAGFLIGYWLFYLEMGKVFAKSQPTDPSFFASNPEVTPLPPTEIVPQISAPPGRVNFLVPEPFKGQVVSQIDVPETEKVIALTFDGGPHPETTAQVLDLLKQHSAKATFFVSGASVEESPALARRIVAEGHAIGNRAWDRTAEETSSLDSTREVDETTKLIQEITGAKTELFRPPNGRLDTKLVDYAQQQGYAVTLWSVDSQDSLVAAPILLDNVLKNVRPGRIVLLHDGSGGEQSATIQALPQLLTALQQQGYRFVTMPELLKLQLKAKQQPDETRLLPRRRVIAQLSVASLPPSASAPLIVDSAVGKGSSS